ncbi:protein phosphatase 2C domain-containing protein, partial [Nocardia fusca]
MGTDLRVWEERVAELVESGTRIITVRGADSVNGIDRIDLKDRFVPYVRERIEALRAQGVPVALMYDGDADDRSAPDVGAVFGMLADEFAGDADVSFIAARGARSYGDPAGGPIRSAGGTEYETYVFDDPPPDGHVSLTQSASLVGYAGYEQVFVGAVGPDATRQLRDLGEKAGQRPAGSEPVRVTVVVGGVNPAWETVLMEKLRGAAPDDPQLEAIGRQLDHRWDFPYGAFCDQDGNLVLDPVPGVVIEVVGRSAHATSGWSSTTTAEPGTPEPAVARGSGGRSADRGPTDESDSRWSEAELAERLADAERELLGIGADLARLTPAQFVGAPDETLDYLRALLSIDQIPAGQDPRHLRDSVRRYLELSLLQRRHRQIRRVESAAAVTDIGARGPFEKKDNQDACDVAEVITPDGTRVKIGVVCDGVSRSNGPQVASQLASRIALTRVKESMAARSTAEEAVERAIDEAERVVGTINKMLYPDETADGPDETADDNAPATTIALTVVEPGLVTFGWLGDSRVYWVPEGAGEPELLTYDHGKDSSVRRYVGGDKIPVANDREIDDRYRDDSPLNGPGYVVVISDGASKKHDKVPAGLDEAAKEKYTAERLAAIVRGAGNTLAAAEAVVDTALELDELDNISAVVISCTPAQGATGSAIAAQPADFDDSDDYLTWAADSEAAFETSAGAGISADVAGNVPAASAEVPAVAAAVPRSAEGHKSEQPDVPTEDQLESGGSQTGEATISSVTEEDFAAAPGPAGGGKLDAAMSMYERPAKSTGGGPGTGRFVGRAAMSYGARSPISGIGSPVAGPSDGRQVVDGSASADRTNTSVEELTGSDCGWRMLLVTQMQTPEHIAVKSARPVSSGDAAPEIRGVDYARRRGAMWSRDTQYGPGGLVTSCYSLPPGGSMEVAFDHVRKNQDGEWTVGSHIFGARRSVDGSELIFLEPLKISKEDVARMEAGETVDLSYAESRYAFSEVARYCEDLALYESGELSVKPALPEWAHVWAGDASGVKVIRRDAQGRPETPIIAADLEGGADSGDYGPISALGPNYGIEGFGSDSHAGGNSQPADDPVRQDNSPGSVEQRLFAALADDLATVDALRSGLEEDAAEYVRLKSDADTTSDRDNHLEQAYRTYLVAVETAHRIEQRLRDLHEAGISAVGPAAVVDELLTPLVARDGDFFAAVSGGTDADALTENIVAGAARSIADAGQEPMAQSPAIESAADALVAGLEARHLERQRAYLESTGQDSDEEQSSGSDTERAYRAAMWERGGWYAEALWAGRSAGWDLLDTRENVRSGAFASDLRRDGRRLEDRDAFDALMSGVELPATTDSDQQTQEAATEQPHNSAAVADLETAVFRLEFAEVELARLAARVEALHDPTRTPRPVLPAVPADRQEARARALVLLAELGIAADDLAGLAAQWLSSKSDVRWSLVEGVPEAVAAAEGVPARWRNRAHAQLIAAGNTDVADSAESDDRGLTAQVPQSLARALENAARMVAGLPGQPSIHVVSRGDILLVAVGDIDTADLIELHTFADPDNQSVELRLVDAIDGYEAAKRADPGKAVASVMRIGPMTGEAIAADLEGLLRSQTHIDQLVPMGAPQIRIVGHPAVGTELVEAASTTAELRRLTGRGFALEWVDHLPVNRAAWPEYDASRGTLDDAALDQALEGDQPDCEAAVAADIDRWRAAVSGHAGDPGRPHTTVDRGAEVVALEHETALDIICRQLKEMGRGARACIVEEYPVSNDEDPHRHPYLLIFEGTDESRADIFVRRDWLREDPVQRPIAASSEHDLIDRPYTMGQQNPGVEKTFATLYSADGATREGESVTELGEDAQTRPASDAGRSSTTASAAVTADRYEEALGGSMDDESRFETALNGALDDESREDVEQGRTGASDTWEAEPERGPGSGSAGRVPVQIVQLNRIGPNAGRARVPDTMRAGDEELVDGVSAGLESQSGQRRGTGSVQPGRHCGWRMLLVTDTRVPGQGVEISPLTDKDLERVATDEEPELGGITDSSYTQRVKAPWTRTYYAPTARDQDGPLEQAAQWLEGQPEGTWIEVAVDFVQPHEKDGAVVWSAGTHIIAMRRTADGIRWLDPENISGDGLEKLERRELTADDLIGYETDYYRAPPEWSDQVTRATVRFWDENGTPLPPEETGVPGPHYGIRGARNPDSPDPVFEHRIEHDADIPEAMRRVREILESVPAYEGSQDSVAVYLESVIGNDLRSGTDWVEIQVHQLSDRVTVSLTYPGGGQGAQVTVTSSETGQWQAQVEGIRTTREALDVVGDVAPDLLDLLNRGPASGDRPIRFLLTPEGARIDPATVPVRSAEATVGDTAAAESGSGPEVAARFAERLRALVADAVMIGDLAVNEYLPEPRAASGVGFLVDRLDAGVIDALSEHYEVRADLSDDGAAVYAATIRVGDIDIDIRVPRDGFENVVLGNGAETGHATAEDLIVLMLRAQPLVGSREFEAVVSMLAHDLDTEGRLDYEYLDRKAADFEFEVIWDEIWNTATGEELGDALSTESREIPADLPTEAPDDDSADGFDIDTGMELWSSEAEIDVDEAAESAGFTDNRLLQLKHDLAQARFEQRWAALGSDLDVDEVRADARKAAVASRQFGMYASTEQRTDLRNTPGAGETTGMRWRDRHETNWLDWLETDHSGVLDKLRSYHDSLADATYLLALDPNFHLPDYAHPELLLASGIVPSGRALIGIGDKSADRIIVVVGDAGPAQDIASEDSLLDLARDLYSTVSAEDPVSSVAVVVASGYGRLADEGGALNGLLTALAADSGANRRTPPELHLVGVGNGAATTAVATARGDVPAELVTEIRIDPHADPWQNTESLSAGGGSVPVAITSSSPSMPLTGVDSSLADGAVRVRPDDIASVILGSHPDFAEAATRDTSGQETDRPAVDSGELWQSRHGVDPGERRDALAQWDTRTSGRPTPAEERQGIELSGRVRHRAGELARARVAHAYEQAWLELSQQEQQLLAWACSSEIANENGATTEWQHHANNYKLSREIDDLQGRVAITAAELAMYDAGPAELAPSVLRDRLRVLRNDLDQLYAIRQAQADAEAWSRRSGVPVYLTRVDLMHGLAEFRIGAPEDARLLEFYQVQAPVTESSSALALITAELSGGRSSVLVQIGLNVLAESTPAGRHAKSSRQHTVYSRKFYALQAEIDGADDTEYTVSTPVEWTQSEFDHRLRADAPRHDEAGQRSEGLPPDDSVGDFESSTASSGDTPVPTLGEDQSAHLRLPGAAKVCLTAVVDMAAVLAPDAGISPVDDTDEGLISRGAGFGWVAGQLHGDWHGVEDPEESGRFDSLDDVADQVENNGGFVVWAIQSPDPQLQDPGKSGAHVGIAYRAGDHPDFPDTDNTIRVREVVFDRVEGQTELQPRVSDKSYVRGQTLPEGSEIYGVVYLHDPDTGRRVPEHRLERGEPSRAVQGRHAPPTRVGGPLTPEPGDSASDDGSGVGEEWTVYPFEGEPTESLDEGSTPQPIEEECDEGPRSLRAVTDPEARASSVPAAPPAPAVDDADEPDDAFSARGSEGVSLGDHADAEVLFGQLADALGTLMAPDHDDLEALLAGLVNALAGNGDPDDVFTASDEHGRRIFIDNPLSRTDVDTCRSTLTPLQSQFEERGRGVWFAAIMARLDEVAAHATGDIDLLSPGPDEGGVPSSDSAGNTRSLWQQLPLERRTIIRAFVLQVSAGFLFTRVSGDSFTGVSGDSSDSSGGLFTLGQDVLELAKMSPDMWSRLNRALDEGYEIEYGDVPEGWAGAHTVGDIHLHRNLRALNGSSAGALAHELGHATGVQIDTTADLPRAGEAFRDWIERQLRKAFTNEAEANLVHARARHEILVNAGIDIDARQIRDREGVVRLVVRNTFENDTYARVVRGEITLEQARKLVTDHLMEDFEQAYEDNFEDHGVWYRVYSARYIEEWYRLLDITVRTGLGPEVDALVQKSRSLRDGVAELLNTGWTIRYTESVRAGGHVGDIGRFVDIENKEILVPAHLTDEPEQAVWLLAALVTRARGRAEAVTRQPPSEGMTEDDWIEREMRRQLAPIAADLLSSARTWWEIDQIDGTDIGNYTREFYETDEDYGVLDVIGEVMNGDLPLNEGVMQVLEKMVADRTSPLQTDLRQELADVWRLLYSDSSFMPPEPAPPGTDSGGNYLPTTDSRIGEAEIAAGAAGAAAGRGPGDDEGAAGEDAELAGAGGVPVRGGDDIDPRIIDWIRAAVADRCAETGVDIAGVRIVGARSGFSALNGGKGVLRDWLQLDRAGLLGEDVTEKSVRDLVADEWGKIPAVADSAVDSEQQIDEPRLLPAYLAAHGLTRWESDVMEFVAAALAAAPDAEFVAHITEFGDEFELNMTIQDGDGNYLSLRAVGDPAQWGVDVTVDGETDDWHEVARQAVARMEEIAGVGAEHPARLDVRDALDDSAGRRIRVFATSLNASSGRLQISIADLSLHGRGSRRAPVVYDDVQPVRGTEVPAPDSVSSDSSPEIDGIEFTPETAAAVATDVEAGLRAAAGDWPGHQIDEAVAAARRLITGVAAAGHAGIVRFDVTDDSLTVTVDDTTPPPFKNPALIDHRTEWGRLRRGNIIVGGRYRWSLERGGEGDPVGGDSVDLPESDDGSAQDVRRQAGSAPHRIDPEVQRAADDSDRLLATEPDVTAATGSPLLPSSSGRGWCAGLTLHVMAALEAASSNGVSAVEAPGSGDAIWRRGSEAGEFAERGKSRWLGGGDGERSEYPVGSQQDLL